MTVDLTKTSIPELMQELASREAATKGGQVGIGLAIAAGICAAAGAGTIAEEILRAAGFETEEEMRAGGVDDYDIEQCRDVLLQMSDRTGSDVT